MKVLCFIMLAILATAAAPRLTVYYMNWSPYSPLNQHQQVRDLPWDRLSSINHAFFRIVPNDDFTEFGIESITPSQDFRPGGAFDQYAEMTALFPHVDVTVSIGGWTDTLWFALMASTYEGRSSFIQACIDLLIEFPWLRGIDIDWEFPGPSRNHEGEGLIGGPEDAQNLVYLLREMRAAFDANGFYDHLLTIAVPSSTHSMIRGDVVFDFAGMLPYLDQIKIMTYDMAGPWTGYARHHTALRPSRGVTPGVSVVEAVEHIMSFGVPAELISIGSPFYTHGWVVDATDGWDALGQRSTVHPPSPLGGGQRHWFDIMRLKQLPGWNEYYDEEAEAAFIFNSDPNSPYFQRLYSFESIRSLQAKIDYINYMGLGGIIVWATAGDAMEHGFPLLTQLAVGFGLYDGEIPVFPIIPIAEIPAVPVVPIPTPVLEEAVEETVEGIYEETFELWLLVAPVAVIVIFFSLMVALYYVAQKDKDSVLRPPPQ